MRRKAIIGAALLAPGVNSLHTLNALSSAQWFRADLSDNGLQLTQGRPRPCGPQRGLFSAPGDQVLSIGWSQDVAAALKLSMLRGQGMLIDARGVPRTA